VLVFAGRAGRRVEIELRNWPVRKYPAMLQWDLRDSSMAKMRSGAIPYAETETITFTPARDGVYLLGLTAGRGWYSLISANVPVGLHAGTRLSFINGVERLYFHVPTKDQFHVEAGGSGLETVRVNVYGPSGRQVATGQTTPERTRVRIGVGAGKGAAGIWSLEITKADEGKLEDNWIRLDAKLPPVLSPSREQVFTLAPVR